MLIMRPRLCTKIDIWYPRYKDKHGELKEPVVLLSQARVHHASPVIIVNFTKAKHLIGSRFAITRDKAQEYPLDNNGKIPCYAIPVSAFKHWETPEEIKQIVEEIFPD